MHLSNAKQYYELYIKELKCRGVYVKQDMQVFQVDKQCQTLKLKRVLLWDHSI